MVIQRLTILVRVFPRDSNFRVTLQNEFANIDERIFCTYSHRVGRGDCRNLSIVSFRWFYFRSVEDFDLEPGWYGTLHLWCFARARNEFEAESTCGTIDEIFRILFFFFLKRVAAVSIRNRSVETQKGHARTSSGSPEVSVLQKRAVRNFLRHPRSRKSSRALANP